ncbi:hypothetical protein BG000_001889 [Podila horticola]|nr:hypothetical protein BG000_001889 [Podila horticola]
MKPTLTSLLLALLAVSASTITTSSAYAIPESDHGLQRNSGGGSSPASESCKETCLVRDRGGRPDCVHMPDTNKAAATCHENLNREYKACTSQCDNLGSSSESGHPSTSDSSSSEHYDRNSGNDRNSGYKF